MRSVEPIAWQQSGAGLPLVLLHGWGMHAGHLLPLSAHLPGISLYTPDLPGHGASASLPVFDLASLHQALLDWLDHLQLDKVVLGGWSLGGMLALDFAARAPERVEKLILIDSAASFVTREGMAGGLADGRIRTLLRDLKRRGPVVIDGFFADLFTGDAATVADILQKFPELLPSCRLPETETLAAGLELLRTVDLRPQLSQISAPALIVHGENDAIIPAAGGRWLAEKLSCAVWAPLSDCGHAPQLSHTAATAARIRTFLA